MNSKNINDEIVTFIRDKPEGVSSQTLAETFLKFKTPDNKMAHIAISGILKNESRCTYKKNSLWYADKINTCTDNQSLHQTPCVVIYLLSCPLEIKDKMSHISVWSVSEAPNCFLSEWLIDPADLSHDEKDVLTSNNDSPFTNWRSAIFRITEVLENHIVLFFTSKQQRSFSHYTANIGTTITDDTMLLSQLFKICGIKMQKPINLKACYRVLFNKEPLIQAACQYGKAYSECVHALFSKLLIMGIATQKQLEQKVEQKTLLTNWKDTCFSLSDILDLPQLPGVYGFKNKKGKYIYIGKAKKLKKRLMSYFRNTEESPEKLVKLRDQAFEFTVYICGSELESLIFEYRLIKKYAPVLNSKISINERKGFFKPLHDCIILLPHAEPGKYMSFWFRENQKTLLKPLYSDFKDKQNVVEHLENFFFSKKLPIINSDFPEQEIIFRWVKQHRDSLQIIPVYRTNSSEEIFDAMKYCWDNIIEQ